METLYHFLTSIITFLMDQMIHLISFPFDNLLDFFKHLFN